MALQKNISIRRSAQKLAKDGQYNKAIDAYKPLLASGSADPYDHLYVGDLYVKLQQSAEAIEHYEAAIGEYQQLGFHRNGVALCRKILRLDASRGNTYKCLGDLYVEEELHGDALEAYSTFLDYLPEDERGDTPFREVVETILRIGPQRADLVQRLSVVLQRVNRVEDALELLIQAFQSAQTRGDESLSVPLKQSILEINPDFAAQLEEMLNQDVPASDEPVPEIPVVEKPAQENTVNEVYPAKEKEASDFNELDLNVVTEIEGEISEGGNGDEATASSRMEIELDEGDLSLNETVDAGSNSSSGDETFGDIQIDVTEISDVCDPVATGSAPGHPVTEKDGKSAQNESTDENPAAINSKAASMLKAISEGDVSLRSDNESVDSELVEVVQVAAGEISLDETVDIEDLGETGPAGSLANPRQATLAAIEAEQWTSAQNRVQEWLLIESESEEAIDCLIRISRAAEDRSALVGGLLLKGDLLISREEIENSVPYFKEVLKIEPDNQTAERRVSRFEEMGLIEADSGGSVTGSEATTGELDDSAGNALTDGAAVNSPQTGDAAGAAREIIEPSSPDQVYEIPELDESEERAVHRVLAEKDAIVEVKSNEAAAGEGSDQQEWMEIGALLEEFKDGLKDQVEENDFQGHYDLAVSHMEMELFDEALEEFDAAISCTEYPKQMLIKTREMRGACLSRLERHREAIHEYRDALGCSEITHDDKSGFVVLLAKELEAVGELDEAKTCLQEILRERPDFELAQQTLAALEKDVA